MRLLFATFIVAIAAASTFGQAPTLRIVTEDPSLPSELFYGNVRVKPLRLRPGTNQVITIQDSDFYVTTQYTDFLSRFPDQSGFGFWKNEIDLCGTNAQCIELKRINVSAAFFLSIEFQKTGFLVYKMNKAAFGDRFGNTPPAGQADKRVPVRRETFMPDTRTIGNNVVVGTAGWEARLRANQVAFALAFVQRAEFLTAFPTSMTASAFVNQLNSRAGNPLNSSDIARLVGILTDPTSPTLRSQVVLDIAENPNMDANEYNKAFVLMQYFGYLRRNPDDAPDSNFNGYEFWLNKLNQFGNYQDAEMVKSFLVAGEYLGRF